MLRYLPRDLDGIADDYLLGWTETEAVPERLAYTPDAAAKRAAGDDWLKSGRSLLAVVTSAVLPETDVIMMNPLHEDAKTIKPLVTRPFSFHDCLALPGYDAPTKPL